MRGDHVSKKIKNDQHPLIAMSKDFEGTDRNAFSLKIGGTCFEISTHFNPKGKQSVLDQFKTLILAKNLI